MDVLIPVLVILALVLVGGVLWMGLPKGPRLKDVEHLRRPEILEMPPQKVLVVEATGDPGRVAKEAFGLVMRAYFKLKGVPKGGPSFKPPRGRWDVEEGRPPEEWTGQYAMPVPDAVESVPSVEGRSGLSVQLRTWEYGAVAQILHVGPYDQEAEDIRVLQGFIRSQGYQIAGPHEEEYLRGPGMLLPGDPERYLTLIRYRVKRMGEG